MNSNNLFKTELYGGEVIWYVISIKQEEYPVEEMKRTSTVFSRYILIEVNGEVWWNKESIEEDLKETLLQSSFGGSQGKDRVSHRFYQIMALLAHYEDDGVLDDFVQYDDVEDYKKIVFSRCS